MGFKVQILYTLGSLISINLGVIFRACEYKKTHRKQKKPHTYYLGNKVRSFVPEIPEGNQKHAIILHIYGFYLKKIREKLHLTRMYIELCSKYSLNSTV